MIFIIIFAGLLTPAANGQLSLGGLVDVELRKGGSDSSPYINQTPTDEWVLYTPFVSLFAELTVNSKLFLQTSLQTDYYASDRYNPVFISLLNLNFLPSDNSNFMVSAGRFITPYGLYSERLLSDQNPFVHLPLSYTHYLPVSRKWGLYDYASQPNPDPGFGNTLIYQRGYSQGLMISNITDEDHSFSYFLAATLASTSAHNTIDFNGFPSFIGRLTFQPATWSKIGVSGSYGSYLNRDPVNEALSDSELSSYKQILLGTDLTFSYLYYTFTATLNWNRWQAPVIDQNTFDVSSDIEANATHFSLESKVRFPFLVGGYVAGRFEKISPSNISSGTYNTKSESWAQSKSRVEGVVGYQLTTDINLKVSYTHSVNEGSDWKDDLFALQVSAAF